MRGLTSFGLYQNELVDLLLNNTMISVALSGSTHEKSINFLHGEHFYSLFQTTVNSELLKKLDGTVPVLMKSAVYHPRMVSHAFSNFMVMLKVANPISCVEHVWTYGYPYFDSITETVR